MNKMVVNHLEKLFVTNDAATIIKELEVYMICDFGVSSGLCDIVFCCWVVGWSKLVIALNTWANPDKKLEVCTVMYIEARFEY